ncbi:MAG: hypothetical protein LBV55_00275 [Acholeplasmatales bacterium]|jgi:hypothetical protein|nr:hypothetical protein [Acholeplasmatales bacterium]
MLNFLKKNYVITLILGGLLLISSILMIVPMGDAKKVNEAWIYFSVEKNILLNFIELVGGFILLFLGFYILIPQLKKNEGIIKFMYVFEFILFLFVAIAGFLVPAICHLAGKPWHMFARGRTDEGELTDSIGFWIGILLFIHGFIVLYSCSYTKVDKPFWYFIGGILLLSGGVFLMVSGFGIDIGKILNYIIIYSFLVVGVVLLVIGILSVKNRGKVLTTQTATPTENNTNSSAINKETPQEEVKEITTKTTASDPKE